MPLDETLCRRARGDQKSAGTTGRGRMHSSPRAMASTPRRRPPRAIVPSRMSVTRDLRAAAVLSGHAAGRVARAVPDAVAGKGRVLFEADGPEVCRHDWSRPRAWYVAVRAHVDDETYCVTPATAEAYCHGRNSRSMDGIRALAADGATSIRTRNAARSVGCRRRFGKAGCGCWNSAPIWVSTLPKSGASWTRQARATKVTSACGCNLPPGRLGSSS